MAVAVTRADFFAPPPSYYSRLLCCSNAAQLFVTRIPLPSHLLLRQVLTIVLLLLLKASTFVLHLLLEYFSIAGQQQYFLLLLFKLPALWAALPNLNPFLCLLHLSPTLSLQLSPPLSLLQLVKHHASCSPPPLNIVRSPTFPSPI